MNEAMFCYLCKYIELVKMRSGDQKSIETKDHEITLQKIKIENLTKALDVAVSALKYMTEEYDCDPKDVAYYDKRKAERALEQIKKIKKGELS